MPPPLPDVDSLATAGGPLNEYSPVEDPTTDRPAAGSNAGYQDATAATQTVARAWCTFSAQGVTSPVLVAHGEVWAGGPSNAAPVVARSASGTYTITYPATVNDEIPSGSPGYVGPHTVNFQSLTTNSRGLSGSPPYILQSYVSAPNVAVVQVYGTGASPALTDPIGLLIDLWIR
jgi:hypothetical protein